MMAAHSSARIRKRHSLLLGAALAFSALIYSPSLKNGFTGDDFFLFVQNDFVKSWQNFPRLFERSYLTPLEDIYAVGTKDIGSGELSYRPVTTATYFLDHSLWKMNALGFHLTNFFLHLLNIALVYALGFSLSRKERVAFLSALLFALHPANTEAVCAINFREDLLVVFFCLLSLLAYRYCRTAASIKKRVLCYSAALISFGLALFSKEMAAAFPGVLIAHDLFLPREKRYQGASWKYLTGFFMVLAFFLWIWLGPMARHPSSQVDQLAGFPLLCRVLTPVKLLALDLTWSLFPYNIHATLFDPTLIACSPLDPKFLFSAALCLGMVYLLWRIRPHNALGFFAGLWFLITLLPVLNIIPAPNIFAARFLYLPCAGFCLLLAVMADWARSRIRPQNKRLFTIVCAGFILSYAIFAHFRVYAWENDILLNSELVDHYPNSPEAHLGLALVLENQGIREHAIEEYRKTIRLDPYQLFAYRQLGFLYLRKGKNTEAIESLTKAAIMDPTDQTARMNLCLAYWAEKPKKTVSCLEDLRKEYPNDAVIRGNLEEAKKKIRQ